MEQREIKFRGKQHSWIYGGFHRDTQGVCRIITDFETFEVDPKSVGEFSGLQDKNGVDIYEGDIIEIDMTKEDKGQVIFHTGAFRVLQKGINYSNLSAYNTSLMVSVIGNIY